MDPHERSLRPEDLDAHAAWLRRLARGLLGESAAADDLVQEAFVKALEHPPADPRGLRAWLGTVTRRLAINVRRGEGRRRAREEFVARPEACDAESEVLERLELAERLAAEVARLREPYRTAVYLRFHEGLGPSAIAERLGVPVKTVETRLARALELLRERLDARGGGREVWSAALLPLAVSRGAPLASAPAVPLAVLTGGLVVKKLALAAVVLIAVAVCVQVARVLRPVHPRPDADRAAVEPVRPPDAVAEALPRDETPTADAAREALEVAPDAAPSATGDLLMTIVWGDDGSPAVDVCAEVEVLDGGTPRPDRIHVRTDADGRARFAGLPAGRIGIYPPLRGLEVITIAAGGTTEHRVELRDSVAVEGRVVGPDGEAVGGAEIRVQRYDGRGLLSHAVARSSSDGTFRARGLDAEDWLGAAAAGYRPSLAFRPSDLHVGPRGAREVELRLGEPGGRLAGRVVDEEGTPVQGAQVLAGPRGGSSKALPTGQVGVTAAPALLLTGSDGGFEVLGDLDVGGQPVEVVAAGHPVWFGTVEMQAGGRAWLEVSLVEGGRIVGRVIDVGGAPRAGARVRASREVGALRFFDRTPVPTAVANAHGEFLLEWVPQGEVEVHASDPEDQDAGRDRVGVVCVAGEQREVELVLDPEPAIRGRVVDGAGRPLAGWSVYASTTEFVEMSPMHPGTRSTLNDHRATNAEGRFLLPNADDHAWKLSVAAPDTSPFPPRAEVKGVRAGASEIEIVIENAEARPSTLLVRLVDVDGRPPQDVRATLWDEQQSAGTFAEYDASSGVARWSVSRPGRYAMHVGRGERTIHRGELVELRAGETVDLGEVRLAEPGELIVDVRAPEGADLELVDVEVIPTGLDVRLTLERDGSTFRAQAVAPGNYVLRVEHKSFFAPERVVEVRPGEVVREEFALVPAFPMRITFELPQPQPEWHSIEWELLDGSGARVRSGVVHNWSHFAGSAAPGIRGQGLPPGRYTLEAESDTGLRAELALDIDDALSARGPHVLVFRP